MKRNWEEKITHTLDQIEPSQQQTHQMWTAILQSKTKKEPKKVSGISLYSSSECRNRNWCKCSNRWGTVFISSFVCFTAGTTEKSSIRRIEKEFFYRSICTSSGWMFRCIYYFRK